MTEKHSRISTWRTIVFWAGSAHPCLLSFYFYQLKCKLKVISSLELSFLNFLSYNLPSCPYPIFMQKERQRPSEGRDRDRDRVGKQEALLSSAGAGYFRRHFRVFSSSDHSTGRP